MGAMLRFKKETDKEVTELGNSLSGLPYNDFCAFTPEEFSHIYKADGAVSRQLGTYAYACGNNHTAVCKERANAPRTSTLSMREEKAGAYESSPGNI